MEHGVLPGIPKERKLSANVNMKRFITGLIVTLIFFGPSLGAACDLSCVFNQLASVCHLERAATERSGTDGKAMGGMVMDGMAIPGVVHDNAGNQPVLSSALEAAAGHSTIAAMGLCERKSCEPGSALAAKTTLPFGPNVQLIPAAAKNFHQIGNLRAAFFHVRADIASFYPDLRSPMNISLRI